MFLENLRLKLRYIGWPFLRLWVGLHISLAVAGVLLARQCPLVEPFESMLAFCGSLILTSLVTSWALRPALVLTKKPTEKQGSWELLFFLLAFTVLLFAVGTVPLYLIKRFGRTQWLPTLAALPQYPPARYYQAPTALLDTAHRKVSPATYIGGGKSARRFFRLAIVCPVARQPSDLLSSAAPVWAGFYYQADTSALDFVGDYWPGYQHFIAVQTAVFRREVEQPCCYFERAYSDQINYAFGEALPNATETAVVVRPVYTPFEARAGKVALWWQWSQGIGNSLLFLVLLALPLDASHRQRLLAAESSSFSPVSS